MLYGQQFGGVSGVTRQILTVLLIVIMVAAIVSLDVLFFRGRFWERLLSNIGIVIVFIVVYWTFLRKR
jgi:hypothetical protein